MKQHQYRVTLEHIADENGESVEGKSLSFNAPNHDDLFMLLEKITEKQPELSEENRQRFVIGLKLMSEVVLENRNDEFFGRFAPYIKEIMMTLKGKKRESEQGEHLDLEHREHRGHGRDGKEHHGKGAFHHKHHHHERTKAD